MESQNTEQLTQENPKELSENLNSFEAIAVNEDHETLENNLLNLHSSFETTLDESDNGTVAQQFAELPGKRTQKGICWDKVNNKPIDCP